MYRAVDLRVMLRLSFGVVLLFATGLLAQEPARARFVRASGDATVSVKPDQAEINIGVSTRAATAQTASSQNAEQSSQVLSAMKHTLGASGQVKTSGYSLNPQYDYQNGHPPRLNGYEASNTVTVTVDDLALLGKVIDAATGTGANNVNGISFKLRDVSAVRAQVLGDAAVRARANAEAIAKALGVQVVGLLSAEPSEVPTIRPMMRSFVAGAAKAQAVATPIEAGDLDIHATVTVTLEVR
ncbi:MAG: SIMPL domain-containing protein [Acidobacteriota bacterium]|nr:SIMPL domain-containing protein [Acidobacteriota bacterium]